jgi:Flp pilus assembly protein TadD
MLGRPDEAAVEFSEALRLDPANASAAENLAKLRGKKVRPDAGR